MSVFTELEKKILTFQRTTETTDNQRPRENENKNKNKTTKQEHCTMLSKCVA